MPVGSRARGVLARHRTAAGYSLLLVLFMVAVVGIGMAAAGTTYAAKRAREHEQELLRIGTLYAKAIQSFHDSAPGNLQLYPEKLGYLIRDPRYLDVVRYLRKLYPDPIQPDRPWGFVYDTNGGIVGVFSTSDERPLAQGSLSVPVRNAAHYSDWIFFAQPTSP